MIMYTLHRCSLHGARGAVQPQTHCLESLVQRHGLMLQCILRPTVLTKVNPKANSIKGVLVSNCNTHIAVLNDNYYINVYVSFYLMIVNSIGSNASASTWHYFQLGWRITIPYKLATQEKAKTQFLLVTRINPLIWYTQFQGSTEFGSAVCLNMIGSVAGQQLLFTNFTPTNSNACVQ